MIIGIDLDNTILNYDYSFLKHAIKKKLINPNEKNINKEKIKNKIEKISMKEWTILQGEVYGKYIYDAKIDGMFIKFLKLLKENNVIINIVSHKTKFPILGKKINLHRKSLQYLKKYIPYNLVVNKNIFFEKTLNDKVNRILECKCDYFIDDLNKVFNHKNFPNRTHKILFSNSKNSFSQNWSDIYRNFKIKIGINNNLAGKNNKCFIISEKKIFVKKFYNINNDDDRYKREIKFVKFLEKNKVNLTPKIVESEKNIIKYELINGKVISNKDANKRKYLKEAFKFIKKINHLNFQKENFKYAKGFCSSSECYENEISNKIKILENNKYSASSIKTIKDKFTILKKLNYFKNNYKFRKEDSSLSPCDFTFNNILIYKKAKFIDFEYSGIDDVAKLYAIFFLQPDHHIKINTFEKNINQLILKKFDNDRFKKNLTYLLPICYLRWSLIMLNDFLKEDLNRRNFSNPKYSKLKNLHKQEKKVVRYLKDREKYFRYYKIFLSKNINTFF